MKNSLCRVVNRLSRRSQQHISPYRKALHWLPVKSRILFKWCLLMYKAVNTGLPAYFSQFFVPYTCSIATRRSDPDQHFLNRDIVPFDRRIHKSKVQFDYCFFAQGPTVWNSLPVEVRSAPTVYSFRRKLKGHLFDLAFPT